MSTCEFYVISQYSHKPHRKMMRIIAEYQSLKNLKQLTEAVYLLIQKLHIIQHKHQRNSSGFGLQEKTSKQKGL